MSANTSLGSGALGSVSTGDYNTACGTSALGQTSSGHSNTAVGYQALSGNTEGACSTAFGFNALKNSSAAAPDLGGHNTALGANALAGGKVTGSHNLAVGENTMTGNSSGSMNIGIGVNALASNKKGNNNIAIGKDAGINLTGNSNIDVGNKGVKTDNGVIRIGTEKANSRDPKGQSKFFAAGIVNSIIPRGAHVIVDSKGQLGVQKSSLRFKEAVEDMGAASRDFMRLRPVTFQYREPAWDGSKPRQFGLIAEEVSDVYPELVACSTDGDIQSVQYQALIPLLLNEVQRQQADLRIHQNRIDDLEREISEQRKRIDKLETATSPA